MRKNKLQNLSEKQSRKRKLLPHEKVVVMITQVAYEGSDIGVYEVGHRIRDNMSILEARDMINEAVLAKIMWFFLNLEIFFPFI